MWRGPADGRRKGRCERTGGGREEEVPVVSGLAADAGDEAPGAEEQVHEVLADLQVDGADGRGEEAEHAEAGVDGAEDDGEGLHHAAARRREAEQEGGRGQDDARSEE